MVGFKQEIEELLTRIIGENCAVAEESYSFMSYFTPQIKTTETEMVLALQIAQLANRISPNACQRCLNYQGKSTIQENAILAVGKVLADPADFIRTIEIDSASSAAAVIVALKSNFRISTEDIYGLMAEKYDLEGEDVFIKRLLLALDNTSGDIVKTFKRSIELPIPSWVEEIDLFTGLKVEMTAETTAASADIYFDLINAAGESVTRNDKKIN